MTRTERLARERLIRNLRHYEDEGNLVYAIRDHCPGAWASLEEDVECHEPKMKVTLRLDRSVAQFYRAMGHGYQSRINRILGTWAQLKIAKINALDAELDDFLRTGKAPWDRE